MQKCVVLLSGGIDSATALYLAKKKGFTPHALTFDYGQRHKKEIKCAKKIAHIAHAPHTVLKIPFPGKSSSLIDRNKKIPSRRGIKNSVPSTYVPARNLIFLSMAFGFAENIKAEAVFIGAHDEDYPGYPDCRKTFFDAFKKAVNTGTTRGKAIKLHAPLLGKGKKEIIKTALYAGAPLEHTWSCYKGLSTPCGVCDSCFFRARAFKELKMKDPYYARS